MIDYFDVDGSKSGRRFVTLCENIITCGVFEALVFSAVQLVKSKFDIVAGSTVYVALNYILLFQSIGMIALVLYMSFRHNCIYVCDDYIEIKDGLLLYVFSPEDQEGFINAVNKRLHKSADQNPS